MSKIPEKERHRFNLDLPEPLYQVLEETAEYNGTTKAEILRRSIKLMEAATRASREGKHLGIFNDEGQIEKEIIGV